MNVFYASKQGSVGAQQRTRWGGAIKLSYSNPLELHNGLLCFFKTEPGTNSLVKHSQDGMKIENGKIFDPFSGNWIGWF